MAIPIKDSLIRYRYPIALAISLACVAGAAWMVKRYLDLKEKEIRQELASQQNLIEVVVAKRDLPVGTVIDGESMSVRQIPAGYIPDGAISPKKFAAVEGKTISEPMSSGRPLVRHNIKDLSRVDKFSDLLGPGQRALTLEVSGTTSIEHMLEAGDKIDLAVKDKKGGAFALLLERVTVLATGNVTTADNKVPGMYKKAEYDSLTLGIDSAQVARILAAEKQGELVFLLRNDRDEKRSRYPSAGIPQIEVIVGKGGEGGVLPSINELLPVATDDQFTRRNAQGRLLKKVNPSDPISTVAKDVAVAHEHN